MSSSFVSGQQQYTDTQSTQSQHHHNHHHHNHHDHNHHDHNHNHSHPQDYQGAEPTHSHSSSHQHNHHHHHHHQHEHPHPPSPQEQPLGMNDNGSNRYTYNRPDAGDRSALGGSNIGVGGGAYAQNPPGAYPGDAAHMQQRSNGQPPFYENSQTKPAYPPTSGINSGYAPTPPNTMNSAQGQQQQRYGGQAYHSPPPGNTHHVPQQYVNPTSSNYAPPQGPPPPLQSSSTSFQQQQQQQPLQPQYHGQQQQQSPPPAHAPPMQSPGYGYNQQQQPMNVPPVQSQYSAPYVSQGPPPPPVSSGPAYHPPPVSQGGQYYPTPPSQAPVSQQQQHSSYRPYSPVHNQPQQQQQPPPPPPPQSAYASTQMQQQPPQRPYSPSQQQQPWQGNQYSPQQQVPPQPPVSTANYGYNQADAGYYRQEPVQLASPPTQPPYHPQPQQQQPQIQQMQPQFHPQNHQPPPPQPPYQQPAYNQPPPPPQQQQQLPPQLQQHQSYTGPSYSPSGPMPGSAPPHPVQHQGQQYGAPGNMHTQATAGSRPTSQYGAIHYSPQLAPQQIRHSPSPVPLSQSQMRRENSYRTNSLNQLDSRGGYADNRTSYIAGQTPISSVLTAEPILAVAGNGAPNLGSIRRHGGPVSESIGYSGTPPQQQQQHQIGSGPGSIRRRDQVYGGGQREPIVQQPPMPPVSQINSMSTLVNSMGNISLHQSQPGAGLAYAHHQQQPRNDQSLHSLTMSVPVVGSHLQSSQATLNNYSPKPPPVSHSQSTFAISTASAVSVPVSSIHSAPLVNNGMSIHSIPDLLHASGSSPVASVQGGCGSTMAYPLWMNMQANCFHAYQHHIPVQQSNFSGTKHALIIGINYYNKEYSQTSNINSAHAIRGLLVKRFGYNEKNVVLLSDDQDDPRSHPTHHLITTAIKRMMRNVQANDSVFFYFCGFGRLPVQVLDKRSEQVMAIRRLRSDFILPIDFEAAGAIDSAYLKKYLVRQLPQSAHLTAIFNCIVNDTGVDIPYKYINPNGTAVVTNAIAGSNLFEAGMKINPGSNASFGDLSQRFETSFMQQYSQNSLGTDAAAAAEMSRIRDSTGDIVVFGWDRDYSNPKHKNYLSHTPGNQLGAFWAAAMESTLKAKPRATYGEVLAYLQSSCKKIVMMPFIASGRKIEMNEEFDI